MKLRRALFRAGRAASRSTGLLCAFGLAGIVARGGLSDLRFTTGSASGPLWQVGALALLLALLASRIAGRLLSPPPLRAGFRELLADFELGLLLVVATFATLAAMGGPRAVVYPLLYILVAYLVAFHPLSVGVPLVVATLALEISTNPDRPLALAHCSFIVLFAAVEAVFL